MRRSQGRHFSAKELEKIKYLLSSTDLALQDIATRMDCAKSSIATINQNFQIRQYNGRRCYWVCSTPRDAATQAQESDNQTVTPS
jgi:hypothetical protein